MLPFSNHTTNKEFKLKGKIYTYQTGKFPVFSSQVYQYLLVIYDYDINQNLVGPIKYIKQE